MADLVATIKVDLDEKLIQETYNKGHSEGYDLGFKVGFDRGCRLANPMNAPIADDLVSAPTYDELKNELNRVREERNAAIEELRSIPANCFCCLWADGNSCNSPSPCYVDDNPDRWEWRGVPDEIN